MVSLSHTEVKIDAYVSNMPFEYPHKETKPAQSMAFQGAEPDPIFCEENW